MALGECGLAVLALLLGRWLSVAPFGALEWSWRGLAGGIAATAPLLLGLRWCLRTGWEPMVRLVAVVTERVGPLFTGSTLAELALVSALASIGEEALFRGVLQPAIGSHLPAWAAVALTGAAFGLAHWLTPLYGLLAAVVGIYLGVIFLVGGNLLVPLVAHGLYDVAALGALQQAFRNATGRETHPPSSVL